MRVTRNNTLDFADMLCCNMVMSLIGDAAMFAGLASLDMMINVFLFAVVRTFRTVPARVG